MVNFRLRYHNDSRDNFWFCIVRNDQEWKVNEYYPLWYCIDRDHNLISASNDPSSDFIVNYRRGIIKINNDSYFMINNSYIESCYRRVEPYRMIKWNKEGDVRSVLIGDYFFQYILNQPTTVTNIQTGDIKYFSGTIEVDDITIEQDDYDYSGISFNQIMRIELMKNLKPFNVNKLVKLPYNSRIESVSSYFLIQTSDLLFSIRIEGGQLGLNILSLR